MNLVAECAQIRNKLGSIDTYLQIRVWLHTIIITQHYNMQVQLDSVGLVQITIITGTSALKRPLRMSARG